MVAKSGGRATVAVFRPGDPLTVLRGVGEKLSGVLAAAGLSTIRDLVMSFPRRHAEVTVIASPSEADLHRLVCIRSRVEGTRLTWLPGRRSMVIVKLAAVADGTVFEVRFFNQPYLKRAYEAGSERFVEGVLERRGKVFGLKQGRILPPDRDVQGPCLLSYAELPKVSAVRFAGLVDQALQRVDLDTWEHEPLSRALSRELGRDLPPFADAVRAMHQPECSV